MGPLQPTMCDSDLHLKVFHPHVAYTAGGVHGKSIHLITFFFPVRKIIIQYKVSILYCEYQMNYLIVKSSLSVFNGLPIVVLLLIEIKETLFFLSCYTFVVLCFVTKAKCCCIWINTFIKP